jgi:DMSO/TMAO reductase YedYZ molybdopterin-dependent catalytic subunit
MVLPITDDITLQELQNATRNHGMPLEGLRYDVTPIGMHYLLIHFDVPFVDAKAWRLEVGGHVSAPLALSLDDIKARPQVTLPVTMECAGNGRAWLNPRPHSQPWLYEAVGTAEWTGTPLAPLLEEAGVLSDAVEVLFTGADRGRQADTEQWYQRSLSVDEAKRPEVILAYAMNGLPLPPQHGYPLRLVVPGWYGMTNVKWLKAITAVTEPFTGFQQSVFYRIAEDDDDPGIQLSRMFPRSLLIPPGMPEFETRDRLLPPGPVTLEGRAWSGWSPVARVEVSFDGGASWADAVLDPPVGSHAWRRWRFEWVADEGTHVIRSRATDEAGNTQPVEPRWNAKGVANNMAHSVVVHARPEVILG